jgi:hypothetical protein
MLILLKDIVLFHIGRDNCMKVGIKLCNLLSLLEVCSHLFKKSYLVGGLVC